VPEKILIIEDNKDLAALYKRALEKAGYVTVVSPSGENGLHMASKGKFDLILLDIMLPQKSGLGVLKELKKNEQTQNTPVYMLTVLGQEDIIKEAFELGADGYLIKFSLTPDEVVTEVKNFLKSKI
jgi:DNA-binding response OmpR family regulator